MSGKKKPGSRRRQKAEPIERSEVRLVTSAATAHEDAPPYRTASPSTALRAPSPPAGEKAGMRGQSDEGSVLRFIDLFCGGFPCQPFSLAGVSKKNSLGRKHGFLDEKQGNFFFSIAKILDYHKPAAFVLENVKNLRSHEGGRA